MSATDLTDVCAALADADGASSGALEGRRLEVGAVLAGGPATGQAD